MSNTMEYRGYVGSVEFSEADGLLYGCVQGVRALISYEGTTVAELISDFHAAVDEYLALCEAEKREPETGYEGSFRVRISPELHRQAAAYALSHQMTLNGFVEASMRNALASNA